MSLDAPSGASVRDEAPAPDAPALGRQIARNTVFILAGRFTYVVGWAAIAPYMIARLGAERFGLWSLLTVFSGLYLTVDLGLSNALTKFVAEFRVRGDVASLRAIYTVAAALYGALALVFVAVTFAFRHLLLDFFHVAPALRAEAEWALVGAAGVYGVLNAYMLLSSVLSGLHRLDLWNRISIVVTLVQLAGVAIVLTAGGGLRGLVLNTGIALLLGVILSRATIRGLAPEIALDASGVRKDLVRRLTRYSAALQIINLGVLVQFQLDKVLFGRFLTLAVVGSYELAYRLTSAAWSLPSLLLPPLLPAVAHLDAEGDRDRVLRLHRRASRYVLGVAFPIAAGLVSLAPVLFVAWLGPGVHDAALATAALGVMLGINIVTGVGSAVARGIGRPGLEAEYQVLAMASHLALGLALVPRWGFRGGLVALVVSAALGSFYFVWRFHRAMADSLARFLVEVVSRPLAVAVVAGAVAWFVAGSGDATLPTWTRAHAALRLLAGGLSLLAVVAVLAPWLGALRWSEVRELSRLARGAPVGEKAA